jgi:hypothetical protein
LLVFYIVWCSFVVCGDRQQEDRSAQSNTFYYGIFDER